VNYTQHRNHLADGDLWPNCQFCQQFIIEPASRQARGECAGPASADRHVISLDEFDELAATDAA
jgi:hypothetical protein